MAFNFESERNGTIRKVSRKTMNNKENWNNIGGGKRWMTCG